MRSTLLIATAIVSIAATFAACATFGDASSPPDAGSTTPVEDAAAPDGDAPSEAGGGAITPSPGKVSCGITQEPTCNIDAGQVCCHEPLREPTCKVSDVNCNSVGAWTYRCDERADCTGSDFCCLDPADDGSRCVATCGNDTALCVTSADCPGGAPCRLYECDGRLRGICSTLSAVQEKATRCTLQ